jgi:hypothetical protein
MFASTVEHQLSKLIVKKVDQIIRLDSYP